MNTLIRNRVNHFLSSKSNQYSSNRLIRNRSRSKNGSIFLDKFIKHINPDDVLSVRAPIGLKVRGTFFNNKNEIDKTMNKNYKILNSKVEAKENSESEVESALEFIMDSNNNMEECLKSSDIMHILFYGKSDHKLESFSILQPEVETTHVYLSDIYSNFELESLLMNESKPETEGKSPHDTFESISPSGLITIKPPQPRYLNPLQNSNDSKSLKTLQLKLYCDQNVMDKLNNGLKALFMVPPTIHSLSLYTNLDNEIDADGTLISGLELANFNTDQGNVKLSNISSKNIRVNTKDGNIDSEGYLDGNILLDIRGSGNINVQQIDGSAIVSRIDFGDINILGDCQSVMSHLAINTGNIFVRALYGNAYILIHKVGFATFSLSKGTVTAIIRQGGVFSTFQEITSDSSIQVGKGDIQVTIPRNYNFRLATNAKTTRIDTQLLDNGKFVNDGQTERFICGCHDGNNDKSIPVLNLEASNGSITIQCVEIQMKEQAESQNDS